MEKFIELKGTHEAINMEKFIEFKGVHGAINIDCIVRILPYNEGQTLLQLQNGDHEVADMPYSEVKALLNAETHLPAVPATPEEVDEIFKGTKAELEGLNPF